MFPLLTYPSPLKVDHMILPHVNTLRVLLSGRSGRQRNSISNSGWYVKEEMMDDGDGDQRMGVVCDEEGR